MPALAKLADFKSLLGWSGIDNDALAIQMLERASSIAESLVGVGDGQLRREQGIVEFPSQMTHESQQLVALSHRPIESVESVKQLYAAGSDADFEAETALVEFEDYIIHSQTSATLRRINGWWHLGPRSLRIVTTAGYVDPSRIEVTLTGATWTTATKTLTETGAFANYSHTAGDVIVITAGTGATLGQYRVASRVDADSITLSESLAGSDLVDGDITSGYSGMLIPPGNLQHGVLLEAQRLWQTKDTAGVSDVSLGQGGGIDPVAETHPTLIDAASRLRRLSL